MGKGPGDFLRLLRGQKHEFLNHLQVILGFLQLGKPERALVYTKEVAAKIEKNGRLMRLKPPEVAFQCQLKLEEAARYQVSVEVQMETEMEELLLPGEIATALLEPAWDLALSAVGRKGEGKELFLTISETEEGYRWHFNTGAEYFEDGSLDPLLAELEDKAGKYQVPFSWSPYPLEFSLWLPRRVGSP
ncbi:hypothetical protein SAMN00808754_0721 [Thermanaeromonas toyohensis ToBE]|uniref:SpoOB alpha-helical domain-containing protein n=1 Tax=Thermanaeromonas toyohensis ToBE TaxID=698762 RepID=A0A1W1VHN2_9FIRM|nr:Spo0B domain-containing protein [Thermanaeromonas toyohensis]SMB92838.1 hypothetical protein SAMN00808754_0721 [Thermanaeromonas toyohensis ToBE]